LGIFSCPAIETGEESRDKEGQQASRGLAGLKG